MNVFSPQPREAAGSEHDETNQAVSSSGGDVAAKNNEDHLQPEPEPEHTAAATAEERPTESQQAATSFVTAETIEVDGGSQHCLQQEPSDTGAALPGKPGGKEQALDEAFAGLGLEGGPGRGGGEPSCIPSLAGGGCGWERAEHCRPQHTLQHCLPELRAV